MSTEVLCYNKGCGNKFDQSSNTDDSCTHHPGVPVFHDALKGWSCCKRRTTDFSDFLNIPGCLKGKHSSEKPAEPVAPMSTSSKGKDLPEKIEPEPVRKPLNTGKPIERPSISEAKISLTIKTTLSLQRALQKLNLEAKNDNDPNSQVRICKHLSCKTTFVQGIDETCVHHPGGPVFHEGMKYWSCCQRKTSDFSAFIAQEGCFNGTHEWKVKSLAEAAPCRYDWHQTGSVVVISIFAKNTVGENSSVKVNQIAIEIDFEFDGGKRNFTLDLELDGIIDPEKSFVTLFGTKAEITLKKAEAKHWKKLDVPKVATMEEDESVTVKNTNQENLTVKNEDDDTDSDFSGIDDVEFD